MNSSGIAHRKYENGSIITTYCDGVVTVTCRQGNIKIVKGNY